MTSLYWNDWSHEFALAPKSRLEAVFKDFELDVGRYSKRGWHWRVRFQHHGRILAGDVAPTPEEAMRQAEDFAFHYPG